MYTVFVRNWWRREGNRLVPNPGAEREVIEEDIETQDEARRICKEYNDSHDPGELSRKAEYTSDF